MKVPLLDLKAQYLSIKDEIDAAVARVHERGNYVMGEEVEAFEEEWARFCGAKYAVGVSSGTDAIYLALREFVRPRSHLPGYGVIRRTHLGIWTPAFTFPGVLEPIFRAGCYPRLHDVDPFTGLLPSNIKPCLVIMPTSLYGRPGNWHSYELKASGTSDGPRFVIEDACQAHGAPSSASVRVYSFYPSKNLGAYGQAGAVVTDDPDIAEAVRELRTYGERERFVHHTLSANYRLDELQAAVLRVKLPHLTMWNGQRQNIAGLYSSKLQGLTGIILPAWDYDHVWHIFAIRVTDTRGRDSLASFLADNGIQTAVRYPVPLHLQPMMARNTKWREGDFPMAEEWARTNLSLPIWPEMELAQVEYVAEKVKEWTTKEAR